jgi:tetratricopeptide (TPR) repeat protein
LPGCSTTPALPPYTPTGDPVVDGLAMLERAPERDRVLWQYRTATVAIRRGQFAEAKELLDAALARLQNLYGPDPTARRARRLFASEARKTFVGEPYERVMAYVYRGVLYWMDGEADNARACFRSAQLMDSDTEDKTFAADYALLEFLDGLATAKLGGEGQDALERARKVARLAPPPDLDPGHNLLCFIETGRGPTKYATGQYGEQLRFGPGSSPVSRIRIRVADQTFETGPWDDLTFQATTRGGRVMDHVLANKAVFKQATDAAGDAAIVGGAIMASQRGRRSSVDEVGVGLMVAGLLSKAVSAATTPAADTRAWDNLPQHLAFVSGRLDPGRHEALVEFLDAHGRPLPNTTLSRSINIVSPNHDTVIFISHVSR